MDEKTLDYYLTLPYTTKINLYEEECEVWIEQLPGCWVEANGGESVETLYQRLEQEKRRWIERALRRGQEIPEPQTSDPFIDDFEEKTGMSGSELINFVYENGSIVFPLRVLEKFWLEELGGVRLCEEDTRSEATLKERWGQGPDLSKPAGEAYPVRLGKAGKWAWIRVDGPRNKWGYKEIQVFDEPPKTEMAITAVLTTFEGIEGDEVDLVVLCDALYQYVEQNPEESKGKSLKEIYDEFMALRPTDEDSKRTGLTYYSRSFAYSLALLRCLRPGFDHLPFEEQLGLVVKHQDFINRTLKAVKDHRAFLEYGTPKGLPKGVKLAHTQVHAAILADVNGLLHSEIAEELRIDDTPSPSRQEYNKIKNMIFQGQMLLDKVPGTTSWKERAKNMRAEMKRWQNLSKEEKKVELLAEELGISVERAQDYFRNEKSRAFAEWILSVHPLPQ